MEKLPKPAVYPPVSRSTGAGRAWGFVSIGCEERPSIAAEQGWNRQRHYALNFILKGTGTLYSKSDSHMELNPDCGYQHIPGENELTLRWEPGQTVFEWYIVMDPWLYQRLDYLGIFLRQPVLSFSSPHKIPATFAHFHSFLSKTPRQADSRSFTEVLIETIHFFQKLFADVSAGQPDDPLSQHVRAAMDYLQANTGTRIAMPELAQNMGVSYASLRRAFKIETGCSMGDYAIRQRIEEACARLGHLTIGATAEELGYPDAFTFSAQFKKYMGLSPRAYKDKGSALGF